MHRYHGRFRVERAIRIAQPQHVGELQRHLAGKEDLWPHPNSITGLSRTSLPGIALSGAPGDACLTSIAGWQRVSCTGIRTGVASGKKRARSATVLTCLVFPFAVPS